MDIYIGPWRIKERHLLGSEEPISSQRSEVHPSRRFLPELLPWFVLVVLEDELVRFHGATSFKENSLHFTDDESERGIQLHGRYRIA